MISKIIVNHDNIVRKFANRKAPINKSWNSERKIYDWKTPYDPGNVFSINYNSGHVEIVNQEIYDYYLPFGIKCEKCDLGLTNNIRPDCINDCKLRTHISHRNNSDGGMACIETRIGLAPPKFKISLSRSELVLNYYMKIPFILRTGVIFGLQIHHRNMNHYDCTYSNLKWRTDHSKLHGQYKSNMTKMKKLENPNNEKLKNERLILENQIETFYNCDHSIEVFEIIDKYNKQLGVNI